MFCRHVVDFFFSVAMVDLSCSRAVLSFLIYSVSFLISVSFCFFWVSRSSWRVFMVCSSALVLLASFALVALSCLFCSAVVFSLVVSLIGFLFEVLCVHSLFCSL